MGKSLLSLTNKLNKSGCLLNQLNFTDFSGLNIFLEATFQLSEDQISSLGVPSKKKVFTNIGYIFKKVNVIKVLPS